MNTFQFNALMVYAIDRDMMTDFSVETVLFSLKNDAELVHQDITTFLIGEVFDAYNSPWRSYGIYDKFIAEYGPSVEEYVMNGGLE